MKDTDEVKFTVGAIRKASEKCGDVKEIFEILAPQVFEEELEDVTDQLVVGMNNGKDYLTIGIKGCKGGGPDGTYGIVWLQEMGGELVVRESSFRNYALKNGRVYRRRQF